MNDDAGGWLWLIIDVAFVALLAGALIYGVNVWRKRRSAAAERVRDNATRELYHHSSKVTTQKQETTPEPLDKALRTMQ